MNVRVFAALAVVTAIWLVPAARAAEIAPGVARGEHVATAIAHCTECHGADLGGGGRSFPVGPGGAMLASTNLTSGAGGVGATYSDADYERAIRHGVRPDGTRLVVMPSAEYAVLTDGDVAALIAYIRSVPAVDRSFARVSVEPPPGGVPRDAPALPAPTSPGAYLARMGGCLSCHGAALHGGMVRGLAVPDISHGGLAAWSAADFSTAMRTGRTPDGKMLSKAMPWESVGKLTDAELDTLYRFLEAAPALPASVKPG